MQFIYDQIKATQAAACLLKRRGGRHDYGSLVKLLYLADRKALISGGGSITGAGPVCMPHGMVLSEVLNSITKAGEGTYWRQFISSPQGRYVSLLSSPPSPDHLSRFEHDILVNIDQEFGTFSFTKLRRYTHKLPEYQDPQGSSIRIDPEIILARAGVKEEYIKEVSAQVAARRLLYELQRD